MFNQKLRYFISGTLVLTIIGFLVFTVFARTPNKIIEVFTGVNIYVDGTLLNMDTEAFIYNGRTYLPVRAVVEAVGKAIYWDDSTNSVYIRSDIETESIVNIKKLNGTYYSEYGNSLTFDGKRYIEKNYEGDKVFASGNFDIIGEDITFHNDAGYIERGVYDSVDDSFKYYGESWTKNKPDVPKSIAPATTMPR